MIRQALFLGLLLCVSASSALAFQGEGAAKEVGSEDLASFVDQFFDREMDEHDVPGAAFALVKNGEIALLRGYGFADLENEIPVDPSRTVFRVGSVSKTLTALTALELVERGDLDLHADVSELLEVEGIELTEYSTEPITLFHLLTHTAGFGERLFGQHARGGEDLLSLRDYLARRLPPARRPPGRVIAYNDHNTALAGLLAGIAGASDFATVARQVAFEPLEMSSSSFEQVSLPRDIENRLALAYRRIGGRVVPLERDYVSTTPAAGLFSTAEDLGHLFVALLSEGRWKERQAISPRSVQLMLATQFRHRDGMRGRSFGFAEGRARGRRTLHKDGQCSGFTARLFVVPEEKVAWISMVNLSIFGRGGAFLGVSGLHRRLGNELMEHLFEQPEKLDAVPPMPTSFDSQKPGRYLGTYRETMDPREGWEGTLLANEVRVTGDPDGGIRAFGGRWFETETGTFEYEEGGPVYLRFVKDPGGRSRWLTYHAGSWERIAWYETARFRGLASLVLWLLLLSVVPVWLIARKRERRLPQGAGWLASAAISLVLFPMLFLTAMFLTDVQVLYSGVTMPMRLVFLLPWIALGLVGVGAVFTLKGRRPATGGSMGIYWTALGLASVVALVFLRLNHLLGWPA